MGFNEWKAEDYYSGGFFLRQVARCQTASVTTNTALSLVQAVRCNKGGSMNFAGITILIFTPQLIILVI